MKLLKYSLLVVSLFVADGFLTINNSHAQTGCTINSVEFNQPLKGSPGVSTKEVADTYTNVTITSDGCEDGLSIKLMSIEEDKDPVDTYKVKNAPSVIRPDNGVVSFQILLDEKPCFGNNENMWGYDCINYLEISNNGQVKQGKPANLTKNYIKNTNYVDILKNNIFVGNCSGLCISSDEWIYTGTTFNGAVGCEPTSASLKTLRNGLYSPSLLRSHITELTNADPIRDIVLSFKARSTNNSCLGKINTFQIKGSGDKKTTQQLAFPTAMNASGQDFYNSKETLGFQIPLSDLCEGTQCSITYDYFVDGGVSSSTNTYNFECSNNITGSLPCNSTLSFKTQYQVLLNTDDNEGGSQSKCSVESAVWDISNIEKETNTPIIGNSVAILKIGFKECKGENLKLSLKEISGITGNHNGHVYDIKNINGTNTADIHSFIPPDNGQYTISFKAGHDECDSDNKNFECLLGIQIDRANDRNIFTTSGIKLSEIGTTATYTVSEFNNKKNFKDGLLYGKKMPGVDSGQDWKITGENGLDSNQVGNNGPRNYGTTTPTYDSKSPCIKDANNSQAGYSDNCYEFLAPIPGFESAGGNVVSKDGRVAITNLSGFQLGDYVQSIFNIALGLLMVLSVVMIVFAGVEYMTVESIYGKSKAKGRITGAVTGLILALGIFLILETINPRLLEINFGKDIKEVSIEVAPGNFSNIQSKYSNDSQWPKFNFAGNGIYKPVNCPEGIHKVNDIYICGSMADNLKNMLLDAEKDGIKLGGGGFRTSEQQLFLRRKNNCPDIKNSPSRSCKPPTAKPGTSNHEFGKAIDFTCDGRIINPEGSGGLPSTPGTIECFNWLKNNAGKFGFINWKVENWHWSIDGK